MKIEKEDFKELRNALSVISPTVKIRYKKQGLSKERYLWDCFWFICDNDLFKPEKLYNYLNDNQIETALKNIL
jgi:hypothetical protein